MGVNELLYVDGEGLFLRRVFSGLHRRLHFSISFLGGQGYAGQPRHHIGIAFVGDH